MNKILVPVDFSENSLNALRYAIHLFRSSSLEVNVLHTYGASSTAFHMISMDKVLEEDAEREMNSFLKKISKEHPNTTFTPKIVKGSAVSLITSMGNSGTYDFIVMGTKGASGLKKVFIGSVAGGVIANTKAPVLVVPENFKYEPIKNILFAISNTPYSDNSVVEPLRSLAKISKANVNILHIANEENPDISKQVEPIKDLNPSVSYVYGTGNINESLKSNMEKSDMDLLCLIRSKKGLFGHLFEESVTTEQTFSSPVPVVVLHN